MSRAPEAIRFSAPRNLIATGDEEVCCIRACQKMHGDSYTVASTWGTAHRAVYIPMLIEHAVTITRMGWQNGATVTGQAEAGIYTFEGKRLLTTGTQNQSGASDLQFFDTPDITLTPDIYFWAMRVNNTTATYLARVLAFGAQAARTEGFQIQDLGTGGVLPETATFANPSGSYMIPWLAAQAAQTVL